MAGNRQRSGGKKIYNYLDATSLSRGIKDYNRIGDTLKIAFDLVLTGNLVSLQIDERIFQEVMTDYIEDRENARKWFDRLDGKAKLLVEQQMIMNR